MQAGIGVTVRPARLADALQWVSMRQAIWPEESPEELGAEAEDFFAGTRFILIRRS